MTFPDDPDIPDDLDGGYDGGPSFDGPDLSLPDPPRPINWNLLSADDAEYEWLELNAWVNWLRRTYGLPASVIPPYWHRHPELLWELSALHLHWLGAYDPDQNGSAPIGWHRDFADARERLREWVAASGSRLDRDRPTRQTIWPGEQPDPDHPATGEEEVIVNRDEDFVQFVIADVNRRQAAEHAFHARRDRDDGDGDGDDEWPD